MEDGVQCSSLLPELLLALIGYTGDVFVSKPSISGGAGGVELSPGVDWVSSSER